jgi:2-C-methyl-D-erythritol 4-phosphate cytidylyltransferase
MPTPDTGVIIVAAGSGSRFGGPKQFEEIGGLPMFLYVVRTFSQVEEVAAIVLVGRAEDIDAYRDAIARLTPGIKVEVIAGGASRQASVSNGLDFLRRSTRVEIVLVHDVARALVEEEVIRKVIDASRKHGSAIAAIPVVDTMKRVEAGEIVETVPRHNLWRAQTPQGARLPLIFAAHEEAVSSNYEGTDESELLERIGEKPCIVAASERNFKITYADDLDRARRMVLRREASEGPNT